MEQRAPSDTVTPDDDGMPDYGDGHAVEKVIAAAREAERDAWVNWCQECGQTLPDPDTVTVTLSREEGFAFTFTGTRRLVLLRRIVDAKTPIGDG
jgi:hypothetical protein